jgi:aryl carrier-like protein
MWRVTLILVGLLLATACYYLPWYTHDTAGFTTNAFDLAEWASLHPAVRSSSPPMLASFLLRFPELALIAALALIANRPPDPRLRWILRGIALLWALRFLPPSDFFNTARADPNYRQMMLLMALGLGSVLVALLLARLPARGQDVVLTGLLLAGIISGWWGLSRTDTLLDNFQINVAQGPGLIGFTLASAAIMAVMWWPTENKKGRLTEANRLFWGSVE